MTDANGQTPAGWYTDPWRGDRLRYWDGTSWTGHVHPPEASPAVDAAPGTAPGASVPAAAAGSAAAAASSPAAPDGRAPAPAKARKKRVGLVIGGVAVAVLALVAAFLVVPSLTGGAQAIYRDRSASYDFTEPMLGLDRDHEFEMGVDYDLREVDAAHEAENPLPDADSSDPSRKPYQWAFEVYYDAGLTRKAEFLTTQLDPGSPVRILGSESGRTYGGVGERTVLDEDAPGASSAWGLHDEYFLVSNVEKDGTERAKPLVTRFTVTSALATPDVVFGPAAEDGSVTMSWTPVDNAETYYVVTQENTLRGDGLMSVVAEVDGTEWTSVDDNEQVLSDQPFVTTQNANLTVVNYRDRTEDEQGAYGDLDETEAGIVALTTGYDIGVIASDGEHFSSYRAHDLENAAGWLPYEVARDASRSLKKWGVSGYIEGIENVQKVLPFSSVDGRTRTTPGYLDDSVILDYDDRWVVALRGRNTQLGEWIPLTKQSTPDPAAAIARYNAEAVSAAAPTGMPRFDDFEFEETADNTPLKDVPDTGYPVFGSTEFTRFIAGHLVAQTPLIDISEFVDAPGAPDPYDAAYEARAQNPYALSVDGFAVVNGGDALRVQYSLSVDEARPLQDQVRTRVDEVVASVTSDGMSARDKVVALNGWLVNNAEYDYEALAAKDATGYEIIPKEYTNAWNAAGTLLAGRGVCASYSSAFSALANAAGVPTVYVTGDVFAGGRHAWNKVNVDGQWFSVDTTWNDGDDASRYLLISDAEFTGPAERQEDDYWMVDAAIGEYATP